MARQSPIVVENAGVYFQNSVIIRRGCRPSVGKLKTMSLFGLFQQLLKSCLFFSFVKIFLL